MRKNFRSFYSWCTLNINMCKTKGYLDIKLLGKETRTTSCRRMRILVLSEPCFQQCLMSSLCFLFKAFQGKLDAMHIVGFKQQSQMFRGHVKQPQLIHLFEKQHTNSESKRLTDNHTACDFMGEETNGCKYKQRMNEKLEDGLWLLWKEKKTNLTLYQTLLLVITIKAGTSDQRLNWELRQIGKTQTKLKNWKKKGYSFEKKEPVAGSIRGGNVSKISGQGRQVIAECSGLHPTRFSSKYQLFFVFNKWVLLIRTINKSLCHKNSKESSFRLQPRAEIKDYLSSRRRASLGCHGGTDGLSLRTKLELETWKVSVFKQCFFYYLFIYQSGRVGLRLVTRLDNPPEGSYKSRVLFWLSPTINTKFKPSCSTSSAPWDSSAPARVFASFKPNHGALQRVELSP